MIELGLGKNMVHSLRFWLDAMGIVEPEGGRCHTLTPFGNAVLGPNGFDPYLEDVRTLWLLHWNLASHVKAPLLAWNFLLFHWQHPEICRSEVLDALLAEMDRRPRPLSRVTIEQHLDIFIHSYVHSRGRTASSLEDGLDCPLVDLELLQPIGERRTGNTGRHEPIYAFRREQKPEISDHLFVYCLNNFWEVRRRAEKTLTFRDVAVAEGSVGQVFKLPEGDLRDRLERLADVTRGALSYKASAAQPMVMRESPLRRDLLKLVYSKGPSDA